MTDTPAAAPDSRPTVLIYEDEALVAMMVEDVVADAGFQGVCAFDGRDAAAHRLAPDAALAPPWERPKAVVMDLRLANGLDGRDVLRRLRERHPAVPAVVVTGFDPHSPEADLRGLGGPTVRLRKPFECSALLEHLAGVLDGLARAAVPHNRRASDLAGMALA